MASGVNEKPTVSVQISNEKLRRNNTREMRRPTLTNDLAQGVRSIGGDSIAVEELGRRHVSSSIDFVQERLDA